MRPDPGAAPGRPPPPSRRKYAVTNNSGTAAPGGRVPFPLRSPALDASSSERPGWRRKGGVPGPSRRLQQGRPSPPPRPCGAAAAFPSAPPPPRRCHATSGPPAAAGRQRGGSGAAGGRAWRTPLTGPHMFTGPRSAGRRRNPQQKPNRIAGGSTERGPWGPHALRVSGASGGRDGGAGGSSCVETAACQPQLVLGVTAKGLFLEGEKSVFQTSPLSLSLSSSVRGWLVGVVSWRRAGWERQEGVSWVSPMEKGADRSRKGTEEKSRTNNLQMSFLAFFFY